MNFCVDCKWCTDEQVWLGQQIGCRCTHPKAEQHKDPVTGTWPTCDKMRKVTRGIPGDRYCTIDGNWYEPKEEE